MNLAMPALRASFRLNYVALPPRPKLALTSSFPDPTINYLPMFALWSCGRRDLPIKGECPVGATSPIGYTLASNGRNRCKASFSDRYRSRS